MQLEIIILREVSQKKKDKYYMISYICNLKYDTNALIHKTEIDMENRLMIAKKGVREKDGLQVWEFGVGRCELLHFEWISNKVLMYSIGNYTEYSVINHNGKEY